MPTPLESVSVVNASYPVLLVIALLLLLMVWGVAKAVSAKRSGRD